MHRPGTIALLTLLALAACASSDPYAPDATPSPSDPHEAVRLRPIVALVAEGSPEAHRAIRRAAREIVGVASGTSYDASIARITRIVSEAGGREIYRRAEAACSGQGSQVANFTPLPAAVQLYSDISRDQCTRRYQDMIDQRARVPAAAAAAPQPN